LTTEWKIYSFRPTTHKIVKDVFFGAPPINVAPVYIDAISSHTKITMVPIVETIENSDSISAADNTAGLQVALHNDYRQLVQFRATLGAAGEIRLEASHNGADWFLLWPKTLDEAGSYCDWDLCAFPYFRVNVPTTGIDIAIDLRAVRL